MSDNNVKAQAKELLNNWPGLYRAVSQAFRSLEVVKEMAYVAQRAERIMMGARAIVVAYPSEPRPRWGYGQPAHPALEALIAGGRAGYDDLLRSFGKFRAAIEAIPQTSEPESGDASWVNGFFTGIDAAALYGMIAARRPKRFLEIGSGYSTKLAARAVRDQRLSTEIISIDPSPQAVVDSLCTEVMRLPMEDVPLSTFDRLEPGDILFFDGSHYAFMNSDVVTLWLDVIPRLRPGVLIHVHDIFLPYDYPPEWVERWYSEQYLLAMALLARTRTLDVVFPNQYVTKDPALSAVMAAELGPRAQGGAASSFWLKTRG